MKENKKGRLLLSPETIQAFKCIDEADRLKLLDCIFAYHEKAELPGRDIDKVVMLSFSVFRMAYDRDQKSYSDKCDRNRENQRKRWEKLKAEESANNTTEYDGIRPNTMATNNNNNSNSNNNSNLSYTERESNNSASLSLSHENERYVSFLTFLRDKCPHLAEMEQPTESEFLKLLAMVNEDANKLSNLLLNMENDKEVPKRRRSIYKTALNWIKLEQSKS